MRGLPAEERAAVRRELEAAELALLRCRRLGATLTDYVRLTLASHASVDHSSGYTPAAPRSGQAGLNARV